jgi:hypothetical protein
VYLEARPAAHLTSLRIVPDPAGARATVSVTTSTAEAAELRLTALLDGFEMGSASAVVDAGRGTLELPLDRVELWDVDSPTLYTLSAELIGADGVVDRVASRFGLVTVESDWLPGHSPADTDDPAEQYRALYVNGEPRYLRCVLDQGYYPDGVYTAPSAEAIRADLERAKALGFNCIRVHVKVDEPLKYRLADELGLYVVYDMPTLDIRANNTGDAFAGRANVEQLFREAIARDANHPSIVTWVLFNENWGLMETGGISGATPLADSATNQAWLGEMVSLARELDPTRPVEDNSAGGGAVGVYEHLDTDLNTFHFYTADANIMREALDERAAQTFVGSSDSFVGGATQAGQPWMLSEFGAFSVIDGGDETLCDLFPLLNEIRRQPKLTGYTLTQLTDVEYEENGLFTYDRRSKDLCPRAGVELADLLADDFVAVELLPSTILGAGLTIDVAITITSWSIGALETWSVAASWDDDAPSANLDVELSPTQALTTSIAIETPATTGAHTLVLELKDATGSVRARNRVDLVIE